MTKVGDVYTQQSSILCRCTAIDALKILAASCLAANELFRTKVHTNFAARLKLHAEDLQYDSLHEVRASWLLRAFTCIGIHACYLHTPSMALTLPQ